MCVASSFLGTRVSVSETLDMGRGMYGGTVLKEVYVPTERTKLKDRSSAPWGLEIKAIPEPMPRLADSSLLDTASLIFSSVLQVRVGNIPFTEHQREHGC